jgi:hypothetical protein
MIGPLAPLSTPEKRAAFEQLKGFVIGVIDAREIEAHAFRLVGCSQEAIAGEARELFEILLLQQSPPLPRSTALGLAFTFHRLLCERIREMQSCYRIEGNGRGNA